MRYLNLKFIHPTSNSNIDVGVPENMILRDVFSQLVEANFLSFEQADLGILKPNGNCKENIPLDTDKTIAENGIEDNDVIQIVVLTKSGGGIGIIELWNSFYPYLDQIGTVLGIAGSMIGFGIWVKKKFSNNYTPKQITEKITDKEFWNYHELALKLNLSDDEAKNLLKGFGYTWNKQFSLYCKTDKTVEIIKKVDKDII